MTTLGQTSPVRPSQVIILWDQDLVHTCICYVICTVLFGRGRGDSNVKVAGQLSGFARNPKMPDFHFLRDTLQVILNQDKKTTAILFP